MKQFLTFISEGHKAKGKTAEDLARKHNVPLSQITKQIKIGSKHELEHTDSIHSATRIAMDHVFEDPEYYTKIAKAGLDEDAPVNNVGGGKIGGAEPGQAPPGKKFILFKKKKIKRKK